MSGVGTSTTMMTTVASPANGQDGENRPISAVAIAINTAIATRTMRGECTRSATKPQPRLPATPANWLALSSAPPGRDWSRLRWSGRNELSTSCIAVYTIELTASTVRSKLRRMNRAGCNKPLPCLCGGSGGSLCTIRSESQSAAPRVAVASPERHACHVPADADHEWRRDHTCERTAERYGTLV